MAMYRCALCGSSHVAVDTKKEGFSIGKGVVGTAIFGPVGAVMGIDGKKQLYYHCATCSQTLSYAMNSFEKDTIDTYLMNPSENAKYLEMEKKRYPNIEWEFSTATDSINSRIENNTTETLADKIWNYCLTNKISYIEKNVLVKEALGENQDKATEAIEFLKEKGMVTIEVIDKKFYVYFYSDKDDIEKNVKFKDALNQAGALNRSHKEELFNLFIAYMEVKTAATFGEISNDFSEILINKKCTDDIDVANILSRLIIISAFKKCKIDMDLPKKSGYLWDELMNDKILKDNTQIQYLSEEESQNAERLQQEERMQARKERLATAPKNEKKPYMDEIKDLLSDDIQRTIPEILQDSSKLAELRNQELASMLSLMEKRGEIERISDGKKAFFTLPGYKERTAGREKELRIEKAKLNNRKVRENIVSLEEEKKHLEEIIKMNSKMLFGEGAKAKKEAKKRLEEIEAEITRLRLKLLPEY